MDEDLFTLHINAGLKAGRESTCGKKVAYPSEESASRAAAEVNKKSSTRKELEHYPCAFCRLWHIGRKMSLEELRSYIDAK
jgi:hypothetical protein